MKKLIIFVISIAFYISCEKDNSNVDNPDIEKFVQQLKNGTYNTYKLGEKGENLWAIMPDLKKEHIPLLLSHAKDTSLISPCGHFPVNPVSSIPPYRVNNNKQSIMLGEYILWCIEGVIKGNTYASLTPILVNKNHEVYERLYGIEILEVRKMYQEWWNKYGSNGNSDNPPLKDSNYSWR